MKINKLLTAYNSSSRYGSPVEWLVIHYVGEPSSARNNCLYFRGGDRQAGAHYFVDSAIWQSIPLSRSAWQCGGGLQDSGTAMVGGNRGARLHNICMNRNSIGIELCCIRKNGHVVPSPQAIKTAAPLVKWLMKKYGIRADHVIRHFDVTGKCCPNGYTGAKSWAKLHKILTGSSDVYGGGSASTTIKTLKKGSRGSAVKKLQKNMNKAVKAGLDVDGIYGNKTVAAVKKFQRKYDLEVDGIAGPKTQKKLKAVLK
ncbi:MAG: N-acetylmuramoyl-L-alanine amidase [Eubacteriaceae bacterium]|nr:N-acetylmuramoyl-L-alanine amidase [Eubacteriaceae bacterium]